MPRISLKDLAAAAGVHYSTASLALRNSPKLPRATRERVQAIAQEMGYKPDAALSALNAYRKVKQNTPFQATLGMISDFPNPNGWRSYHTGAYLYKGVKAQAERQSRPDFRHKGQMNAAFVDGHVEPCTPMSDLFKKGPSQDDPSRTVFLRWQP